MPTHGFSVQKPQYTKKTKKLYKKFIYPESAIYNVDETAIYYDTPPHKIWAIKGRRGSAKVKHIQKNSGRLTAVLTIQADGKKLPNLFILRGMPGGTVDTDELPTYPPGHVYTVQENGWGDVTKPGKTSWQRRRRQLYARTSVSQPLDVGVMGPLKKMLMATRKKSTTRTAKQKRLGAVMRTIRAWEDIPAKYVVKSFEKAIPKESEVMV
ncbi:LOW QUALITY PROTEIN: hypothetical protein PHMEG_00010832 [Phytophthora megakarya]|uniref:DDE-1 domain-containing protein n=1 Tax=Phytophthora megakarya TaxID=4795 RepID=A0A225WDP0_9STRA|nr:LOW QUALITY PROTEIN: hypothetical protein PHMEG_00010832 [Phytophthora megakarya]